MELIMLKLVNGEVVMGKNLDETDTHYFIGKPVVLMMDPIQQGIGMIPLDIMYTGKEVETQIIEKHFVMYELPVQKEFEEGYIKQTSGIELAA
jgi:hypothetical protein